MFSKNTSIDARQDNLMDNAAMLAAVLNTVTDAIITMSQYGIVQSFNRSAERMFGYSADEVVGQNVKMLMPDPYYSEHDGYLKHYLSTGNKKVIGVGREVQAKRKDGKVFFMELNVNEMTISGVTMFVGTIRDISDRKSAEQDLKDNQASLQAIVDNTVDGLITINEVGRVETFNKACEVLFGYKTAEVIGNNVKMLMPEPYHSEHDGYLKNYHTSGTKKIIGSGRQVEGKKKDGTIFPMDLSISEVDIKGKKIYSGIIRDITELQEAQQRLAAVLDNTVDGLITIDENGCIEHYNKACEAIFGFNAREAVGQNVKILMPEPYHSEHDGYLKNYHNTGSKKIIGSGREVVGLRKNGSTFPLDLSVSEVNVQGRKLYSGIVRDISVRKKAEADIKQANSELEEFAYRTSHDLRSPLISSIGLLDIVTHYIQQEETDSALASIGLIQVSLGKLEDLVKDILTITKVQHAEEDTQCINTQLFIDDTIDKIRHMPNFERLDIRYDLRFNGMLYLPKSPFALIIENLLTNAVKYQDLTKSNSFIRISTYSSKINFVLEVSDNGLGIPKDQRQNLFKMFKRFHPKTSFGSGLGLYLIKKSVDKLNGQLNFEDVESETRFVVVLPLNEVQST
ncbi:PAS domain-containing sensor histidine kinase [uncultured Paraglaciecola sp.]|uniref:PAS domain-containing sensor histidine kinase n=1 Tax=uncultured Paraglaciecola sp. TaxID=1765024 RepID=UPI0030D99D71|tara:strand:- start:3732 stop:5606 length:1875 start_codon:yes stop_codon:yes gene_type:complete